MSDPGHERWEGDLGAYLLGALAQDEARAMERHLAGCERCQDDERRLRISVDALAGAAPATAPPRSLWRGIERLARERDATARSRPARRRAVWRPAWRPAVVAVASAAALAGAAGGYALRDGGDPERARTIVATATPAAPDARARMVVRDGAAELVVARLAPPPAGRVYQVWLRSGRAIRPSTLFTVDRRGRGAAAIPGGVGGEVDEVMVSQEPARGSLAPTTPPRLRIALT